MRFSLTNTNGVVELDNPDVPEEDAIELLRALGELVTDVEVAPDSRTYIIPLPTGSVVRITTDGTEIVPDGPMAGWNQILQTWSA